MTSTRKSKKYRELMARMNEPSTRRQRGGTQAWIENHKESELIQVLIAEHAKRHAEGQGLGHAEFVERVLAPEFGYPYEGSALRTYILKHLARKDKKRG